MRTSGGRGYEGWIIAIPVIAFVAAAAMTTGGMNELLYDINRAIRQVVSAVADFVRDVF